jgi:23S rRNA (cytosine1962-C5)-methyltransferase
LIEALREAVVERFGTLDAAHATALRLFNGFSEGWPGLVCDLYGRTLVLHDTDKGSSLDIGHRPQVHAALELLRAELPWLRAGLCKTHHAPTAEGRNGVLLFGELQDLEQHVVEAGVRYAVALMLHRDCGLYLDTRELRAWAKEQLGGKRVLNTFAHTGSLGVAARVAGAATVIHVDRRRAFLDVARASYRLNGLALRGSDFRTSDFFIETSRLRRQQALFDCVFLDPPLFSATPAGRVDLQTSLGRLIDKVRPLVGDGGALVVVNNALWVSGQEQVRVLEESLGDGYIEIETLIPVPPDVVGYRRADPTHWPADPTPFNHPTKIAVLRVRRKDGRRA